MALLIPENIPSKASQGEKDIFKILSQLPEDCFVIYEGLIKKNRATRRPDFIVIHPHHGVLVIEVKGWLVDEIISGNNYHIQISRKVVSRHIHPIEQCRNYMLDLMKVCEDSPHVKELLNPNGKYKGRFTIPFNHLVYLSNINQSQMEKHELRSIFNHEEVFFRDEITEKTDISKFFRDFKWTFPVKTPLSSRQVSLIRSVVHPEAVICTKNLKLLDARQAACAMEMGDGHRILKGLPGSGKTLILQARAKYIAGDGSSSKRVLFVCFNFMLAKVIQRSMKSHSNIDVYHFDGFVKNIGFSRKNGENNQTLGERILTELSPKNTSLKYDAIMIDESQDFDASWFKILLMFLRDPENDDLVIAGDGNQSVYKNRGFSWKDVRIKAVGRTRFLDVCYRSSKEIVAFALNYLNPETDPSDSISTPAIDIKKCIRSTGHEPMVVPCPSVYGAIGNAIVIVENLIRGKFNAKKIDPLNPSEIAILYPHHDPRYISEIGNIVTCFKDKGIDSIWVSQDKDSRIRILEDGVKIQTIHSSKGLQYRAIVILWCGESKEILQEDKIMFVGATRAEDYLAVVFDQESNSHVIKKMTH